MSTAFDRLDFLVETITKLGFAFVVRCGITMPNNSATPPLQGPKMLQSVMFSDLHAYDFSFISPKEMKNAVKGLGEKVSFAQLATWGRDLLRHLDQEPMTAHLLRDVRADG